MHWRGRTSHLKTKIIKNIDSEWRSFSMPSICLSDVENIMVKEEHDERFNNSLQKKEFLYELQ